MDNLTPEQKNALLSNLKAVQAVYKRLKQKSIEEPLKKDEFLNILLDENYPLVRFGYLNCRIEVAEILSTEESTIEFENKLKDLETQFENL